MTYDRHDIIRFLGAAAVVSIADYLIVLTDCVIAGRVLGEVALSGLNLLMPIFSLVTFVSWLVATAVSGSSFAASQHGEDRRAAELAGQGIVLSALIGIALVVIMRAFEAPYLMFLAPDESVQVFSGDFWKWYHLVVPFQMIFFTLGYLVYRRDGERICLLAYAVVAVVNLVASLILARKLGISGVSYGTLLSLASGIAVIGVWMRSPKSKVKLSFRWNLPAFVHSIRFSLPETSAWLFQAVLFLAILKYILYFWDSESLAVSAVVFYIVRIALFFAGAGLALKPLEARKHRGSDGRNEVFRLYGIAASASFVFLLSTIAFLFFAPEALVRFFGISSADLVDGARGAVRLTVVGVILSLVAAFLPIWLRVRKADVNEAPLSYFQDYALSRIEEGGSSQMFNLAKLFRLRKGIDLEKLSASLVESARSHASLLSVLRLTEDGSIVQRQELKDSDIKCPVIKYSEEKLFSDLTSIVKEFKLFGGRLFDARIFDCGEHAYLLSNFHHLICDGYSFPLILEDAHRVWNGETLTMDKYYETLAKREERSRLPQVAAERAYQRELMRQKKFVSLPAPEFHREAGLGVVEMDIPLPENFTATLASARATRHHIFFAATIRALARLTGAQDLLVDWTFHGRVSKDELRTVGPFMLDLPLIVEGVRGMSAADLLKHVKGATFKGIKTAGTYRSVEDCNPTGEDRLAFIYQDEWGELMSSGPVRPDGPYAWMIEETIPLTARLAAAENPFNVEIMEHQDSTRLFIEYDTGKYTKELVVKYAELFKKALAELCCPQA